MSINRRSDESLEEAKRHLYEFIVNCTDALKFELNNEDTDYNRCSTIIHQLLSVTRMLDALKNHPKRFLP